MVVDTSWPCTIVRLPWRCRTAPFQNSTTPTALSTSLISRSPSKTWMEPVAQTRRGISASLVIQERSQRPKSMSWIEESTKIPPLRLAYS